MISIITPVFNAEKYLPRCLDSILAQTCQDWELLLINDGSTDGSARICDDYASRDARMRVYNKENGGVASARQWGIEQARGEYSIHIDSDDWVEPQMLEDMLGYARNQDLDIVIADYYMDKAGSSRRMPQVYQSASCLRDLLTGRLHGSLCNKLIRHELYRKHNITFVPGVDLCEDLLICIRLFQLPIRVATIGQGYYHYMHNGVSSMAKRYDMRMYDARRKYIGAVTEYLPPNMWGVVADINRQNELTAMLQGVRNAREVRLSGLRLTQSQLLSKGIGLEGRLFVLFYMLGLTPLCEFMQKHHLIRV